MAKASMIVLVHCLVAVTLLIALVEGGKEPTICNIPLSKLDLCRPAVTGEYPPKPTRQCCGVIKKADLICLCKFKDDLPAFNIEPTQAFALPKKCNRNARIPPQCKA